jgi:uncharacterized membrane protein YeaQ/YmgE (transglycosylase-associated protein family)
LDGLAGLKAPGKFFLLVSRMGATSFGTTTAERCYIRGAKQKGCNMSIIGWIVLGLIAGFIASKIVNKTGEGMILDIILGIIGGVVGGWLFSLFGAAGVTGFNIYSMVVAVIGAIVVLVIYHAITGRRAV